MDKMTRYAFKSGVEYYLRQLLKDPVSATLPDNLKKAGFKNPEFKEKLLKRGIISQKESLKNDGAAQFQIQIHVNENPEAKIKSLYDELFNIKESVFKDEDKMKKDILNDKELGYAYKTRGGINETDCGGCMQGDSDGQYVTSLFDKPMRRRVYITEKQAEALRKHILSEEGEGGATTTFSVGGEAGFSYDAPAFADSPKKGSKKDFFKDANDHSNIMAKSWEGGK